MMTSKNKIIIISLIGLSLIVSTACKKLVEVGPPTTQIVSETVFTSDASATSAIRGIYSLMVSNSSFTNGQMERYTGLSCDELKNYSLGAEDIQFYLPSLSPDNSTVAGSFWGEAYSYIFNANAMLEGLGKSTALSPVVKNELEGEAKFIRAFCHFYLVNLFGPVPYVTTTDYNVNASASRIPVSEVYDHIRQDLIDAQQLMVNDYSLSNNERIQPNRAAATAMLARVYLYTGDWANAEAQASSLINNTDQYSLETDLDKIFLANSSEAIWQLKPVVPDVNTQQAVYFILISNPLDGFGVALDSNFLNAFEVGDQRRDHWISSYSDGTNKFYFPYKYKVAYSSDVTEYSMILRLSEQYLVRAEARVMQNNFSGSQEDINAIRHRAGLGDTPAADQNSLLQAVAQERKIELFAEWGHRWLDLKRTSKADAVLGPIKTDWQSTDALYPVPLSEINIDPHLTQNPGY